MDNRKLKYMKKIEYSEVEKVPITWDLYTLNIICAFVISENESIKKSQLFQLRKLINQVDIDKSYNDQERIDRMTFIIKGLEAKLDLNYQDRHIVICHINGNASDKNFIEDEMKRIQKDEIIDSAEVALKYKGYIERERQLADKIMRLEYINIPENFDFDKVESLSIECRQKLKKYSPRTIAQASRISGVSPADVSVLLVYFGR